METVDRERPDVDDTTTERGSYTVAWPDGRTETIEGSIDARLKPSEAGGDDPHVESGGDAFSGVIPGVVEQPSALDLRAPHQGAEGQAWAVSNTTSRPHDPAAHRAARVSAAKALVMVRRRTGKAIPADVLALAAED